MRAFLDRLFTLEQSPGILSISVMHGFPWSDAEATSAAMHGVFDTGIQPARRADIRLAGREGILRLRWLGGKSLPAGARGRGGGPGAAPSGRAGGDGGRLGQSRRRRGLRQHLHPARADRPQCRWRGAGHDLGSAGGASWRAMPVLAPDRAAHRRQGGPASGQPVDVLARVLAVPAATPASMAWRANIPKRWAMPWRSARAASTLSSTRKRQQVFSPECFTELGIDLSGKRLVVVKSTRHFRACFDPIAAETIFCDTPGTLNGDLAVFPTSTCGGRSGRSTRSSDRNLLNSDRPPCE
jgi:hypothetical protein